MMSNYACFGYVASALYALGYSANDIDTIIDKIRDIMDIATETEAERYYTSARWKEEDK